MIELSILIVIIGLACSNLSHVLTEIDLFKRPRDILSRTPIIGKVFTCKFCQSNWLALIASAYISSEVWVIPIFGATIPLAIKILIVWQALHWISRKGHKVEDPVPLSVIANADVNVNGQGSGS